MTRRNRRSRNQAAPGWVWMSFGLGLGLIVATIVYLRTPPAPSTPVAPAPVAATPAPAAAAAAARSAPARATTPPAEPAAPAESRFAFYEILPQFEVVVPETDTRAAAPVVRSRPVEEPGSYLLQAGSFSAATDADRLQASLALLGIESRVQRVTIDDDVFHRVRIGPISDLATLNRTRGQLRDAGIDPLVMKGPR